MYVNGSNPWMPSERNNTCSERHDKAFIVRTSLRTRQPCESPMRVPCGRSAHCKTALSREGDLGA
jgi:hypothetical protein